MFDWLKKLGGGRRLENKAGLDRKALDLLAKDFSAVEKLDSELPVSMLRYALDGQGDDVLVRLASTQGVAVKLALIAGTDGFQRQLAGDRSLRDLFFESVRCEQPQLFVRLGRIYEAALNFRPSPSGAQVPALGDPKLGWLEALLIEAFQVRLNCWPRSCRSCAALNADLVEAMLKSECFDPAILVCAAFQPPFDRFGGAPLEPVFIALSGLAGSAARHRDAMITALTHTDFKQRVYALGMMKQCKVSLIHFVETLVALATDSSKQVREQAWSLLSEVKEAARPLVEGRIVGGTNDEKIRAIELLWGWDGEKARALLQGRMAEEKNKKVLRTIEDTLALAGPAVAPKTAPLANLTFELPPPTPMPSHAPLGPETERAWQECFEKVNAAITQHNASQTGPRTINPFGSDSTRKSFERMQTGEGNEIILNDIARGGWWQRDFSDPFREFWQRPELSLVHLVRFLIHLGSLRTGRQQDRQVLSYGYWLETLLPAFRRTHPDVGLRELGAAFTVAGLDAQRIAMGLLQSYQENPAPLGLAPAQIWPYWAENLHLLEQAFAPPAGGYMDRYHQRQSRRNAFHALATFPHPPGRLVPLLWRIALAGKSERPPAQRCLEALPDKHERLVGSLGAGEAESRLAAADWLGRIGDRRAIAPLLTALKRERNEATKSAMMSALELLGAPVEQFLDRAALLKEAEKGAAKDVPGDLKWFPFDRLPEVHWSDNGRAVEHTIVKWWLVQGFKLKRPEPGALLRKYCDCIKASEREALGQFVLDAWVGKDTSPRVGAEAEAEAMKRAHAAVQSAQHWAQWVKQNPQMAPQMAAYAPPQRTLQEHYETLLPLVQAEPTGTAISSKGMLSLAGACVGAGAAPVVARYLKQWYGMRAAQCRALLQMLAWVGHKTATQLLLAVGTRFRTKGIQEEANLQARALAERNGWTVAELADRTIPTAGLDDDGVLALDFGPRQFTAKLNEDLALVLTDAEGKPLKSLPDPRKDDDEAKAVVAKKHFSAARKELKSVVTMQRDRFYEAMCTQRTWPYEDWNMYLNRHPIARHHCQRLVWGVVRDERIIALFRPLADGSLTDVNDDPVVLNPEDQIRVAHECQVTPEESLAWRQHLKDYDVEPLFEQFGRPGFDLGEDQGQADELSDFRGHILEAFKLRGRANKLGYTRGQAQDGGWFYEYHKRFPTLGIEAVLEFTGNGLPEENRTVALTTFRFERVVPEGEPVPGGAKMLLGVVPPVLLGECWNDLRQIAAEGPGFDPEWEKKSQM